MTRKLHASRIFLLTSLFFAIGAVGANADVSYVGMVSSSTVLDGAGGVAISPGGQSLYAIAQNSSTLVEYSRSAVAGTLSQIGSEKDGVAGVDGLGFSFEQTCPVVVTPDGRHVYAAARGDGKIARFSRATLTGALSYLGTTTVVGDLSSLVVSPDGASVYVTDFSDRVWVYSRDSVSGALSLVETETEPVGETLDAVHAAVSSDGQNVYVASFDGSSLFVYSRDSGTGALTLLQVHKDGQAGVDGLAFAHAVAVSPDGENVYVAAQTDNAIAVFTRVAGGTLSFLSVVRNGVAGVSGLQGAYHVAVSPDGTHVYAAGRSSNSLVSFVRNAIDGSLTFENNLTDGAGGVDGLSGVNCLAISPDSHFIYAAGSGDDAIALFSQPDHAGDGVVGSAETCDDGNLSNGDGCNDLGQVEDCWSCSGEPSVCTPGATTIATLDSAGDVGRYVVSAIGSDNLPFLVYFDTTNQRLKVAHCNDAACSTRTTTVVDTTLGNMASSDYPEGIDLAIGSDGLPIMSYYSIADLGLRVRHCNNVACTSSSMVLIDFGSNKHGPENTLTIGADGLPLLIYGVQNSNTLNTVHCSTLDCSSHTAETVIGTTGAWSYEHATLAADNLALAIVGNGDAVRSFHCNNTSCSTSTNNLLLTPSAGSQHWISAQDVAIKPDGKALFAYHDGDLGTMNVARCSDTACTSLAGTSLVDGDVGLTSSVEASASMRFGSDGRARIAYWDKNDGDLRFALCRNSDCTTSDSIALDTTGVVGRYADMVSSGGRPLVSYYDVTNADLKVAFCGGGLGNGVVDPGEECDDGNLNDDDGCSSSGQIESCYDCSGAPSVCTPSCGSGGDLDPGYGGGDGIVTTPFGSGDDRIYAVALQPDGRAVAVGYSSNGSNKDFAIARYLADGTLDTSFSGDGKLTVNMAGEDDFAEAVAIQPDGKIVVVGEAYNGSESYNVALLRLNADGSFDNSFSGDGRQFSEFGGDDRGFGVALQPDGKIVVGGMQGVPSGNNSFLVARYNTDGTNDATFDGDGVAITDMYGDYDQAIAVALQDDGRIVLGGICKVGGNDDFCLARYNSNGSLDTSFSGDGKVSTAVGSNEDAIYYLAIQSDGRILATGETSNGANNDFALLRYLSNGSLDPTFGSSGKVITTFGSGNDYAREVAIDAHDRIVVAGFATISGNFDFAVARFLSDGQLDLAFDDDGKVTTPIGSGDDRGFALAIDQAAERFYVGGSTYNGTDEDFALVRYADAVCGDGALDSGEQCDDGNLADGDCCSSTCQFESAASACASDGNVCTTDLCNGSGACMHAAGNAGTLCRASGGVCDPAETCTGASASCPADAKSTAVCRGPAGVCDSAESCDGIANDCPSDAKSTAVCRGSAGVCDIVESCDGVGNSCPVDAKSSSLCRGSAGVCDLAETCNGVSNSCPADAKSSALCRAAVGVCDLAESCNGVSNSCPADAKSSATCRASGGICDIAEACDGIGNACPADAKSSALCRPSAGICDVAETCNGVSNSCPTDAKSTATCRNSAGICDLAETCDGAGNSCPADAKSVATCRAATGDCDVAEICNGVSDTCGADAKQPTETACSSDSNDCTDDLCDGAGTCAHAPIPLAGLCNWAILGGNDTRDARVRTRLNVSLDGSVCADRGDFGEQSLMLGTASWALLRDAGTVAKARPMATLQQGSVAAGGGCIKGVHADVLGTDDAQLCCDDGLVDLPGGGTIDMCGTSPLLDDCELAKSQVAGEIATLNALASTQNLGAMSCTLDSPCTITASDALNVIDISSLSIANDGVLSIDAGGNPDAVIILRLARGVKTKLRATIELVGGAQTSNVAFYASLGNCQFGDHSNGAGTLFCPAGKVRMTGNAYWEGSIGAGSSVDLGNNVTFVHVPFLGLAH